MLKHPSILVLSVLITTFSLASCFNPMNVPEKVHLTGSPEFALPLTNKEISIDKFFSTDKLRESLASGSDLKVYDYPPNDIQTFLLYYPIDSQALSFGADQFKFKPPENEGNTTIDIDIPKIGADGYLTIPPGGQPINLDALPPASRVIQLDFSKPTDGTQFKKAKVKEGKIVFFGSGLDASAAKVTLRSDLAPDQTIPFAGSGKDFPLDEKWIFPDTKILLGGTIKSTGANNQVRYRMDISQFSEMEVKTGEVKKITQNISINLKDMAKWAESVDFDRLKIRLDVKPMMKGIDIQVGEDLNKHLFWDNNDPILKKIEEVSGEDMGFSVKGDSGRLTFSDGDTDAPKVSYSKVDNTTSADHKVIVEVNPAGKLDTDLTLYDVTPGGKNTFVITPRLDFNWTEAVVYPNKNGDFKDFSDTFPSGNEGFNIHDMLNGTDGNIDLADVKFKAVNMYLYLNGPDSLINNLKINLYSEADGNLASVPFTFEDFPASKTKPGFQELVSDAKKFEKSWFTADNKWGFSGSLPTAHFTCDMSGLFNEKPENLRLTYKTKLSDMGRITIKNGAGEQEFKITPYVIIELPLSFTIAAKEGLKIDFPDVKPGKDLLGRENENDDTLNFLESIALDITYDNELGLDDTKVELNLHSSSGRKGEPIPLIKEFKSGSGDGEISLDQTDIAFPFVPASVTVLPTKPGPWELSIKRDASINMKVKALVKTDLDQVFEVSSSNSSSK